MKKIFSNLCYRNAFTLLLILTIPSNQVSAQNSLKGKILDASNGLPIKGVSIKMADSYLETLSDQNGDFYFPEGKHASVRLIFSHISYEKDTMDVQFPSNGLEIRMRLHTYLSEEITISATRVGDESAIAHSNISKTELEKYNLGQDMPYLLQLSPSMVVTSDAGHGIGYTGMRLRGSDASRINVTVNGIPVNDAESHQVYWVDLPDLASATENIQIQRGVGTSTNGSGAFGGSVNIQTMTLRKNPYASLSSSAGSFNTYKNTLGFGSGLISEHFTIDGNMSMIQSDGYVDRASSNLKSFFISGGYLGKNSSLKAVIFSGKEKTYQAWNGTPEDSLKTSRTFNPAGMHINEQGEIKYYEDQTDNYQQDNYQIHYTQKITYAWDVNLSVHATKGTGYYQEYSSGDAFSKYNLPDLITAIDTIQYSDFIRQRWLDNNFYGLLASTNYQFENSKLTVGASANTYEGDHFGKLLWSKDQAINILPIEYYKDKASKKELNAYAKFSSRVFQKLYVFVDIQLRTLKYDFEGRVTGGNFLPQSVSYSFFNPKLGLSYSLAKNQRVYFSFAVGQKEPVRDDFVNSTELSRPKSEKMEDYEAGYQLKSGKIQVGLNYYFMNYRDQLILNGKINDVGEYTRQNVDKSFRTGLEFELRYIFSPKLIFEGNLSTSQNKINRYEEFVDDYDAGLQIIRSYNSVEIAFSPSVISSGRLTWNPFQALNIDVTGKYVGKQFLDNTGNESRKMDEYFVTDAAFRYVFHLKSLKELGLKFQVNNVFNSLYNSNGYTYSYISGGEFSTFNYYYPQAGTNFMAGINLLF